MAKTTTKAPSRDGETEQRSLDAAKIVFIRSGTAGARMQEIAEEAGVIVPEGLGQPLDAPLDVTSGVAWAAFANRDLQRAIEPLLIAALKDKGA